MVKKGQAAMEFMMTYGWAILVVLIAIAALAFFGVLNPGGFFPNSCTVQSGVGCEDFKVSGGADTVQVLLVNGLGDDLTSVSIGVGSCTEKSVSTWNDGDTLGGDTGLTMENCGTLDEGQRYEADIQINYTGSSEIEHTMTGQIRAEVEA